jgi:hypothetical protein
LNSLYKELVKSFKWSLKDIDDTNLETLIDFVYNMTQGDPNTRVINGKEYRRAAQTPSWI